MKASEMKQIVMEILDILDEGVHVIDCCGNTVFYNKAMSTIERMDRDGVLRRHFREVFSYISDDDSTMLHALNHKQSTWHKNQEYLNEYGAKIHTVNSTIPLIINDELFGAVEVSKNVTDYMNMSRAIIDLKTNPNKKAAVSRKRDNAQSIRKYTFNDIRGNSKAIAHTIALAQKAAESDYNILISGETGTGKELFAQSIHYASQRSNDPFLAQNCAALPESLLESILFGTVKGSFTGAVDRNGLFVQADGGTLLLDEISAMPYTLQSKLLRVIQEQYIRPIGGTKDIPVNVRIIATINEPADKLIEDGRLRSDLYYRLNVINLDIPPLRERKEDIIAISEDLLMKHSRVNRKNLRNFSDDAIEKLLAHDYPGNVRELENIIISTVAMAGDEYLVSAPMISFSKPDGISRSAYNHSFNSNTESLPEYIEKIENSIIDAALTKFGGNYTRAAAELGIKRQALQYKLNKPKQKESLHSNDK